MSMTANAVDQTATWIEQMEQGEPTEQEVKPYKLRRLCAKDIFTMSKIISKIGIREFKECFESESVQQAIAQMSEGKGNATTVGIGVALEIANVIIRNLSMCEKDIYNFLADLSGIEVNAIMHIDMGIFLQMIIDVIKKEEFKDFFGVVSKLFK